MSVRGVTYPPARVEIDAEPPAPAETERVVHTITVLTDGVEFSEFFVRVAGQDDLLYVSAIERDEQGDIILTATHVE